MSRTAQIDVTQELIDTHLARATDPYGCVIFHAAHAAGLDVESVDYENLFIPGYGTVGLPPAAESWQRAIAERANALGAFGRDGIDVQKLQADGWSPQPFSFQIEFES